MKLFAILIALTCAAVAEDAAPTKGAVSPILVELFTSEGCSSCPPVDALLLRLDTAQPVAGAQLVILSEHVDYWNRDGWEDPYSSSLATERQKDYVRALGLNAEYTPQIIVDGTAEVRMTDPQGLSHAFERADAARKIPVRIGPVGVEAGDGKNPPQLWTRIEADGASEAHNAGVFVAIALDHAESQVLRGENSGKRLTHVAVLESIKKIGRLDKGKSFGQDFRVRLKPGTDPANLRVIAFVQEAGPGKVLGAAMQKITAQ